MHRALKGCCNKCPGDDCPRRQLSKGLLSNDTVVQADYCPRRLLSKDVFTSKKFAQIDFSFFLLRLTIQVCYILKKNNMSSFQHVKLTPWTKVTLDKRLLGKLSLGQKSTWTNVSLDNRPLDNCCDTHFSDQP